VSDSLERSYRRLVSVYPAGHRAIYAEDMINVLMDDARPGQERPGLLVGLDLMRGAAAAWALRVRAAARAWQQADASAAVALLALLALCTSSFTAVGWVMDGTNSSYGHWGELGMGLPILVWVPVAVAAVLGLRRVAAWMACTVGVLLPAVGSALMSSGWTPGYLGSLNSRTWLALTLIATAGLFADRGLRPGIDRLGRRVTALTVLGVVLIGVITMPLPGTDPDAAPWSGDIGLPLLGLGIALFVLACVQAALPATVIRVGVMAAALVFYLALAYGFASTDGGTYISDLTEQLDITLPLMPLLVCALTVYRLTTADPGTQPQQITMSGTD
jgi:hypothetical protein